MLQDDFESSDQEIRLKALKRVKLVADVLGPEVTRSELIPFINSESCKVYSGRPKVCLVGWKFWTLIQTTGIFCAPRFHWPTLPIEQRQRTYDTSCGSVAN